MPAAILGLALALALWGGAASARSPAPARPLAATPYMGWDSSFALRGGFTEADILEQASRLKTLGLERDGYRLIWLDAGWWQGERGADGQVEVRRAQWPHGLAWLARVLHENGFELGVYTDGGASGCGLNAGSYGHYEQDIDTFARWGVDAVKVDWCGGSAQDLDPAAQYGQIHQAIEDNPSRRPMLLEICNFLQPGQRSLGVPNFGASAFASYSFGASEASRSAPDSWRTDTDIGSRGRVTFASVLRNLDADATEPQAAGPNHWNDPGYLAPDQSMSAAQFRTQFSMWAILAAPLMVSRSMLALDGRALATISNRRVIAVDQDPAGVQGWLVPGSAVGTGQAWARPLSDGSFAVALLNRGAAAAQVSTTTAAVGLPPAARFAVENLWSGRGSTTTGVLSALVPPYSTVLLRVRAG
jgi:alpha-galactosidase